MFYAHDFANYIEMVSSGIVEETVISRVNHPSLTSKQRNFLKLGPAEVTILFTPHPYPKCL